jgi:glycosyltransferase involved in cell wall biosynthesis
MPTTPAISFLLSTRNRRDIARECVLRLLSTRRQDIEVVVRDNGSTDATLETLRGIRDPRLKVHGAPSNQGTISFFEIAKLANGEIVTWLSDEDDFQFEQLDFVLASFGKNPGCDFLFGSIVVGPGSRRVEFADETITDPVRACIVAMSFSGCGGLFVRRTALAAAHSFNVRGPEDAYALWNFYPVGFFATQGVTRLLATTSRIVVVQTRFARTINNWSEEGAQSALRAAHYYPESVFDRLASNLVNVYFKPLPAIARIRLARGLIRSFRAQSAWFSDPQAHALLRENYSEETVQAFLQHIRDLRLDRPIGRLLWSHGRTLALPAKFWRTLRHWRRLSASSEPAS